ncbi:MAG: hypothetical protein B9S32_02590 [Verrucomicrobia bacterium Tous-C9LFEB]|nr:MAG: hypothetical protein B9S32_02590 [Verrucomicrobia bacterium Tous-C9LFEB]
MKCRPRYIRRVLKLLLPLTLIVWILTGMNFLEAAPQPALRLWEGDAPGALDTEEKDIPTITPVLPEAGKANGTALVVCPGGGYSRLSGHEGLAYAEYFAKQGVTCFVLKYRVASDKYHHPAMMLDAARAMRTVRAKAATWGVDPNKIGIIGSSAGGHLASTTMTHFDAGKPDDTDPIERVSSRPDYGILCYAVISFQEAFGHIGSRNNNLGVNPDRALVDLFSNETQVTAQTPPAFIWSTLEDKVVNPQNSLAFAAACQAKGVPYDLHLYQKGVHGIGLSSGKNGVAPGDVHPWAKDVVFWMQQNGWLPAAGSVTLPVTTP